MEATSQPEDWIQHNPRSSVLAKLKAYSVKSPAKQVLQHSVHRISRPLYRLMTKLKTPAVLLSCTNNLIGKSNFSTIPPKNTIFGPYSLKIITYLPTSFQNTFSSRERTTCASTEEGTCIFNSGGFPCTFLRANKGDKLCGKCLPNMHLSFFCWGIMPLTNQRSKQTHFCSSLWKTSPTVLFCPYCLVNTLSSQTAASHLNWFLITVLEIQQTEPPAPRGI